ncbi:hypothetical protein QUB75_27075 [Microcoleus sp. K1-B6]|uniref:hypothetical protein n=1 Tax=unclassified Microcoleus TaxID=2642155 RepID=UPI002FD6C171
MPYFQASELLKNPEASLDDLLTAIEDLGVQYGYIVAMASQGLREDSEIDLVRLLVLIKSLRFKITQLVN